MTAADGNINANRDERKLGRIAGVLLLLFTSYMLGLARGRTEKSRSEYDGLRAQYQQLEQRYSGLKLQYDQILAQYPALHDQYQQMQAQYASLRAQYDRIEKQRGTRPRPEARN